MMVRACRRVEHMVTIAGLWIYEKQQYEMSAIILNPTQAGHLVSYRSPTRRGIAVALGGICG
jgi:hypothetical protein